MTIAEIRSTSPSLCAVADSATIHLDRRLAATDTLESAVGEIRALPGVQAAGAEVVVLDYAVPSWRGLTYPTKKYYPTWLLPEDHPVLAAGVEHVSTALRRAAGGRPLGVQHERRGRDGHARHPVHRLRSRQRDLRAHGDRADPGRSSREGGGLVCRVPRRLFGGQSSVRIPACRRDLRNFPNLVRGKDYIETRDWSDKEIDLALKTAADLKKAFRAGKPHRYLPDKTVFLFFFDKSTRTRNSFEAGATQLGAHAHFISAETSQVAHGESPKDMGIILSSYGHAIAIRHDLVPGEGNAYMREVAEHAKVPVFNMQCDIDHPFQTLADLMTIREEFGKNLKGRKIAVTWAYAPSYAKPMSVPQGSSR